MYRLVLFISLIVFIFTNACSVTVHHQQGNIASAEVKKSDAHPSSELLRSKTADALILDSIFTPHSIPLAGIPVLENALGDVVQDSVINILDLLRLRDIVIGRPPIPTSYEIQEGDIDFDGNLDFTDLNSIRDILLYKKSIPHLIDSTGGKVMDAGVTLSFERGAVDSNVIVQISSLSIDQVDFEIPDDVKDSVFVMKGFEYNIKNGELKIPPSIEIRLENLPPCSLQGNNILFGVGKGQFGETVLSEIGEMTVIDSRKGLKEMFRGDKNNYVPIVGYIPPPPPSFNVIDGSEMPGGFFKFECTGSSVLLQGNIFEFSKNSGEKILLNPDRIEVYTDKINVMNVTVPDLGSGFVNVRMRRSVSKSQWSSSRTVEILPLTSLPININQDSLILNYFSIADTFLFKAKNWIFVHSIPIFPDYVEPEVNRAVDSLNYLMSPTLRDLILIMDLNSRRKIATFAFANNLSTILSDINDPLELPSDEAFREGFGEVSRFVKGVMQVDLEMILNIKNENMMKPTGGAIVIVGGWILRGIAYLTTLEAAYERGEKWAENNPIERFKNFCINIWNSLPKTAVGNPTRPYLGEYLWPRYTNIEADAHKRNMVDNVIDLTLPKNPLSGSIVAPAEGTGIKGIVGIMDDDGIARIPAIKKNTIVHVSLYDPKTGFYDSDIGHALSPDLPKFFPIIGMFNPDTTTRRYPLQMNIPRSDSINLSGQVVEYYLKIAGSDTSKFFNLGFHATAPLSLKLEDPQGNLIIDNTNTSCYLGKRLQLNQVGTYKIRVAFGTSVQPGSFTVGVSYYPTPPLGSMLLCNEMVYDTLYQRFSPYLVPQAVLIPAGDTVIVEPGVEINFNTGASLRVEGLLEGTATEEDPIVLRPATIQQRRGTDIRAVKSVEVVRKEGGK